MRLYPSSRVFYNCFLKNSDIYHRHSENSLDVYTVQNTAEALILKASPVPL